jgi:PAS domain-containing protein
MASVEQSSEQARQEQDARLVVDTIPTLAWSARADGSADFFNQRWLKYTGLSAEQARDWGWVAAHPDDLNALVDYWRSVLTSGEPGEIGGRLARILRGMRNVDVYEWPLLNEDCGRITGNPR